MIRKIKLKFVDWFIKFYNYRAIKIINDSRKHYMFDENNDKLLFWINVKRYLLIDK